MDFYTCFKLHLPWCCAVTALSSSAACLTFFHADGQAAGHSLSRIRLDLLDQDQPAGSCRQSKWVPVQRGCPSSPALAARASFCWMWYSWNLMEIRWVILRYFCRQDSEQLDWKTKHMTDLKLVHKKPWNITCQETGSLVSTAGPEVRLVKDPVLHISINATSVTSAAVKKV